MSTAVDLFFVYQFIRRLTTPFDETDAFELGLIDEKGKRLKKAKTPAEKKAMTLFDRMIFNIKRLIARVPGGNTKIATYGAALFLLKESKNFSELSDKQKLEGIINEMNDLDSKTQKTFNEMFKEEDAPTNSVAGGGVALPPDPLYDKKRKKRGRPVTQNKYINAMNYIKRKARESNLKEKEKENESIRK